MVGADRWWPAAQDRNLCSARGATARRHDDRSTHSRRPGTSMAYCSRLPIAAAIHARLWRIAIDARSGEISGDPHPLDARNDNRRLAVGIERQPRRVCRADRKTELIFGLPIDVNSGKVTGPIRRLRDDAAYNGTREPVRRRPRDGVPEVRIRFRSRLGTRSHYRARMAARRHAADAFESRRHG